MPQNPDLLGTKAVSGEVLVFDRTKHGDEPDKDGIAKPDIRLVGQSREGYGLAWNPLKMGHVLGASEDMTVCHWDIQSNYAKKSPQSQGSPTIEPTNVFKGMLSVMGIDIPSLLAQGTPPSSETSTGIRKRIICLLVWGMIRCFCCMLNSLFPLAY